MAKKNKPLNNEQLQKILGVVLRETQNKGIKCFADQVESSLVSGHYSVLKLIHINPGSTQSALAEASGLDRSSMVPIIDEFERRGWVSRSKVKHDRRAYAVFMMPPGEKEIKRLDSLVVSLEDKLRGHLGAKNFNLLLGLLKDLSGAFDIITSRSC